MAYPTSGNANISTYSSVIDVLMARGSIISIASTINAIV